MVTDRLQNFLHGLALVVAACIPLAAAVKPVDVQGSDFVNTASKDRLQIIGVAFVPPVFFYFPY